MAQLSNCVRCPLLHRSRSRNRNRHLETKGVLHMSEDIPQNELLQQLIEEVRAYRRQHTRTRYLMVSCLVSLIVVVIGSILYTNYSVGKNNGIWCELMSPLDKRQQSVPPQNGEQKEFQVAIHNLTIKLGC